ncbi:PhoPQ-activated pathogenicity-related family protein [Endozoicomonas sp.]|nr:PhoPQ-activated pathogenicity-related family protein [Endozoicomonas sp.]
MLFFTGQMIWAHSLRAPVSECQSAQRVADMSKVLPCYLNREEPDFRWEVKNKDTETVIIDKQQSKVARYFLTLTSLRWQEGEKGKVDYPLWKHRLTIYKPEKVVKDTALLYINGGTINPEEGKAPLEGRDDLEFARIAAHTQSVVVDLKDVPNQYLRFAGGKPLKEDQLIAYTWSQFMMNPDNLSAIISS